MRRNNTRQRSGVAICVFRKASRRALRRDKPAGHLANLLITWSFSMNGDSGVLNRAHCSKICRLRCFEGIIAALCLCLGANDCESGALTGMCFALSERLSKCHGGICLRQRSLLNVMIITRRDCDFRIVVLQLSISVFLEESIQSLHVSRAGSGQWTSSSAPLQNLGRVLTLGIPMLPVIPPPLTCATWF